jgi:hypothetical protein
MVVETAQKYIGYLEHLTNDLLGIYDANVGKGGCTIFAQIINRWYRWRNFTDLPWCVTFVHSVFLEALGKKKARMLVGKPTPSSRVLYRRFKRRGLITDQPKRGDIAFMANCDRIDHVGIVVCVEDGRIITIEGNTTDPTGVFQKHEGGAVAQRVRMLNDPAFVCFGKCNGGGS